MAVQPGVGPFGEQRVDEALGFAVGLRPIGVCDARPGPERGGGDRDKLVATAVVSQHALDRDARRGDPGHRG